MCDAYDERFISIHNIIVVRILRILTGRPVFRSGKGILFSISYMSIGVNKMMKVEICVNIRRSYYRL